MSDDLSCPSSRAKKGSSLLGVRQEDGTIAILPSPLPVDEVFLENADKVGVPAEQRFRFTNKCIEGGCKQWDGKKCGVADRVMEFIHRIPESSELPKCAIRSHCRWYSQEGEKACKLCPYIITEITEEEIDAEKEKLSH